MADETINKIDALTSKYTEGFGKFSKSQSGSVVHDFITFKRNLVPHTLTILFVLVVAILWIFAVLGIFGQGPIGDFCSGSYLLTVGVSVATFVFAPFVVHYVLELYKVLWAFVLHVYEKVLVPIWNTLVISFMANVAPQVLPFLYQRFMKAIDIFMGKLDPLLDTVIGLFIAGSMAIIAVVKGCLWLPKNICQRIGKWLNKPADEEAK
ncbi:MAG: hypothetical protein ACI4QD_04260 [Kiritimatiellia bacterium]